MQGQQIAQVADHERIFGTVDSFHAVKSFTAPERMLIQFLQALA